MFNNSQSGFMNTIPPVTKNLLIINVLMLVVMMLLPNFEDTMIRVLALHYWRSPDFNPIQLVTYMFLHGGIVHLFFNMFSLYMFGRLLERVWGSKRFLIFYFVFRPLVNAPIPLLTTLGQNTLPVYILHGFIVKYIGYRYPQLLETPIGFLVVMCFILVIAGNPITTAIFSRLLPDYWIKKLITK